MNKLKKEFKAPEFEVVAFEVIDVLTTSGEMEAEENQLPWDN